MAAAPEVRPPGVRTPVHLWLRVGGAGPLDTDELVGPAPASSADTGFSLLVGAPGEPLPEFSFVLEAVRSLEPEDRDRLVINVFGAEAGGEISLAQQLADALDTRIRTQHGVFVTQPDGTSHRFAFDARRRPTWRPFAQLCSYWPGRPGAEVDRWWAPCGGLELIAPARFRLTADWAAEVVPAGLVVRPVDAPSDPLLRCAPTHPDHVDLVVDAAGGALLPDGMLTALGRLADSLASSARSRLRLVLVPGIGAASERALGCAVPAPQVWWTPMLDPGAVAGPGQVGSTAPAGPAGAAGTEMAPFAPHPDLPAARLATVLAVNTHGRMLLV